MGASRASQKEPSARRVGHALAGGERARGVVEAGGLDRVDGHAGQLAGQGDGAAGDQAAAAAADEDGVERGIAAGGLLRQLQPDRALAGHDQGVVVGADQHGAGARGDLAADGLAVVGGAVVGDHLGAERARAVELGARRVGRHHDRGRHAQELGGHGHALGMVARRVGDHGRRAAGSRSRCRRRGT